MPVFYFNINKKKKKKINKKKKNYKYRTELKIDGKELTENIDHIIQIKKKKNK